MRVATTEGTAHALRREIAAHNRQVLLIATFTLLVAALLWTLLYAVCRWIFLFGFVVIDGTDGSLPRGFDLLFAVAALCSVAYAWLDSRLTRHALPRDDKRLWEIAADFILALPRITLTVWGTLRAWLWLDVTDCAVAADFLHRLHRERRVAMHSLPLDIPDEARRFRVLFALQIMRVIEIRRDENETLVTLNSLRPRSLFIG